MRAVYKTPRRACVWCAAFLAAALVPVAGAQQIVYVCGPGSGADTCVPSDTGVEEPECPYETLEQALEQWDTNTDLEIVLRGPRTPTCLADTAGPEVIYPLIGGRDVPNNVTLTIRGDNLARRVPYKVVIDGAGLSSPMFTVKPNGKLILEGVTLRGGGSSAILTQTGGAQGETASVTLNRVLVRDFVVNGLTLGNGATATITNSIFYRTQTGLRVGTGATANVAFSTFIQNNGPGAVIENGAQRAQFWGCLFYQNAGPAVNSAVTNLASVTVASCFAFDNAGDFPGPIQILEPVDPALVLPNFMKPDPVRLFPGDVEFPIPGTNILKTALPSVFNAPGRDFEFDLRGLVSDPQVGADVESGALLDIDWTETLYDVVAGPSGSYDGTLYVGRGAQLIITIRGRYEALVDAELVVKPETVDLADGIVLQPRRPAVQNEPDSSVEFELRTTSTVLDGRLLDGRLTVNLLLNSGELLGYGGITETLRVTEPALLASDDVVIDTTPPVLQLAAEAVARDVYVNSTDTSVAALDRGLRAGEDAWPPQTLAVPFNNAPLLAGAGGATPKLFFGYANAEPLLFEVRARFIDPNPEGAEGLSVEKAGFIDVSLVDPNSDRVLTVEDLGPDPEHPLPYWSTNVAGDFPENTPATRTIPPTFGEVIDVFWTVSGVPPLFDRYWKTTFQPAALDRAFNASDTGQVNPVELWWMPPSAAKITAGTLGGNTNSAPSFSFGLERPGGASAPSGASPCDPIYSARLWVAQGPDPTTASWRAIGPWTPYSRTPQYAPAQDTLAQFTDSYLAITVRGADEAGNVQPEGAAAQDEVAGLAAFDADGIAYDFWYNPGGSASLIDTAVQAEFFYDANLNAEFDPADARLGGGPRLPWNAEVPLRAQFLVNFRTASAQAFVNWALFQDGIQVASDVALSNTGSGVFAVDPAALPALGDEKRTVNYRFVAYVSGGGPDPSAVEGVDRTPAVKTFSVYPPGEVPTGGEDQPILVFERE